MTASEAKKEINEMGPQILAAARKGPRELMRISAAFAPRLRELRPYLAPADQSNVDRILRAVETGGF